MIVIAALCAAVPAVQAAAASAAPAAAGAVATSCKPAVHLPKDESPHSAPVEWWYFSGHLRGTDAAGHVHTYGYEYVIFQFLGVGPKPLYYADLSIADLTRKTFHYAGKEDSYTPPVTPGKFELHDGAWTMSGGSGRDALDAGLSGYTLDLGLQTTEPAVLQGSCGIIPMGPIGSSYYYSWTSLKTTGTVTDHGVKIKVTGTSWMDHQWGALELASGAGWDWFSMQLSNGQQYMLYFIRNDKGTVVVTIGTRVADAGKDVSHLSPASFSEKATGSWTSPATHITYGSGWKVTVPGGTLTVTPDLLDQEVDLVSAQGVVYWEGDVTITGRIGGKAVSGVGYTEINPPEIVPPGA